MIYKLRIIRSYTDDGSLPWHLVRDEGVCGFKHVASFTTHADAMRVAGELSPRRGTNGTHQNNT